MPRYDDYQQFQGPVGAVGSLYPNATRETIGANGGADPNMWSGVKIKEEVGTREYATESVMVAHKSICELHERISEFENRLNGILIPTTQTADTPIKGATGNNSPLVTSLMELYQKIVAANERLANINSKIQL